MAAGVGLALSSVPAAAPSAGGAGLEGLGGLEGQDATCPPGLQSVDGECWVPCPFGFTLGECVNPMDALMEEWNQEMERRSYVPCGPNDMPYECDYHTEPLSLMDSKEFVNDACVLAKEATFAGGLAGFTADQAARWSRKVQDWLVRAGWKRAAA